MARLSGPGRTAMKRRQKASTEGIDRAREAQGPGGRPPLSQRTTTRSCLPCRSRPPSTQNSVRHPWLVGKRRARCLPNQSGSGGDVGIGSTRARNSTYCSIGSIAFEHLSPQSVRPAVTFKSREGTPDVGVKERHDLCQGRGATAPPPVALERSPAALSNRAQIEELTHMCQSTL
jgi:hypothetical protein